MSSIGIPLCIGPMTKSADPTATSMWVLTPALLRFSSRSYPRIPPSSAASTSRNMMRVMVAMSGTSENSFTTVAQISMPKLCFSPQPIAAQRATPNVAAWPRVIMALFGVAVSGADTL